MTKTEIISDYNEVRDYLINGFPFYGVSPFLIIFIFVVFVVLLVIWNLTGKGKGSHAGREEVRRSYRRELARQMAREDADKIRAGTKKRRRWMQW